MRKKHLLSKQLLQCAHLSHQLSVFPAYPTQWQEIINTSVNLQRQWWSIYHASVYLVVSNALPFYINRVLILYHTVQVIKITYCQNYYYLATWLLQPAYLSHQLSVFPAYPTQQQGIINTSVNLPRHHQFIYLMSAIPADDRTQIR